MSLLDTARLEGGLVNVQFGDAIQHAHENLSIDGAPTVTITLLDPDRELIKSKLWQQRSILEVAGRRYVLTQTDKQPDGVLVLIFEQWEVYVLRQRRTFRKARRSRVTRVEFAQSLCRESLVKFHAPEAGPPPPLYQNTTGGSRTAVSPMIGAPVNPLMTDVDRSGSGKQSDAKRTPPKDSPNGFADDAKITIKGAKATAQQKAALTVALHHAVADLKIKDNETLVGMIMCGIAEGQWYPHRQEGGGSQHWGIYQQASDIYTQPERGDAKAQTHEFLLGAGTWDGILWKPYTNVAKDGSFVDRMREFTGERHTIGWVIEQVERSGQGPGLYDPHHAEAQFILASYDDPEWKGERRRPLLNDKYEFTRGKPGQRESSWDCLGRLAEQIGWRRFMVGDTVWFVSDEWLIASRSVATLREGVGACDRITWSLDVGKVRDECYVDLNDAWIYAPGVPVIIDGEGPADGRWLIAEWERDLLAPDDARGSAGSLRLIKPGETKKEPVGDQTAKDPPSVVPPDLPTGAALVFPIAKGVNVSPAGPPGPKPHNTDGLPGYPAIDFLCIPGTGVLAPENGRIERWSGHPPTEPPPQGGGGPWGLSTYLLGDSGSDYYITHMQELTAKPGQRVRAGQIIAIVGDYPGGTPDHAHIGVHPGPAGHPDIHDLVAAPRVSGPAS